MTLSTWLRDYLYIPLGGNRHGALATARNLMLTMLLGGLWHGANWTFLIWGAMHGAALVADHSWRRSAVFAAMRRPNRQNRRLGADVPLRLFRLAVLPLAIAGFRTRYILGIWTDNGAQSAMPGIVPPLIACGR